MNNLLVFATSSLLFSVYGLCPNAVSAVTISPTVAAPQYGSPYPLIRDWGNLRSGLERTSEQIRIDHARVLKARLGTSGVTRIFGHPLGPVNIPIGTPGLEETVRLSSSSNRNVARGHRRELVYANRLASNPDIEIEGFGRRVRTASGMTDADLEFRDRRSGVRYRAEIKEVQPTNFERTKATAQIDKMVEDGRRTGRKPIYVNRHGVPAWLQEYATQKGVPMYQNVVTGEKSALRPGNLSLEDVGKDLQKSGGRIGRSELSVNRTSKGAHAWGRAIGRGGAIVAVTFSVVEGSVLFYRWQSGAITNREAIQQGSHAAASGLLAGGGAWGGAMAGAAIGSVFPGPGTFVGGVVGGVIGGVAGYVVGDAAVNYAFDYYFALEDEEEQRKLHEFVYQHYGLR